MKSRKSSRLVGSKHRKSEASDAAAMVTTGKRKQMTLKKQNRRQILLARVMETQSKVKAEKEYGRGLANMNDMHAAIDELQEQADSKALRVRFTELSKSLGKSTMSTKNIVEEEARGLQTLFERWNAVSKLTFSEVCDTVKQKLEVDAQERKIKLERYNDIKSSVISGMR